MGRQSRVREESRRKAPKLVIRTVRPVLPVAKELSMSEKTLGNSVRQGEGGQKAQLAARSGQRERELRELRCANRELKLELEILRQAATYFARETTVARETTR
jgi:transposase